MVACVTLANNPPILVTLALGLTLPLLIAAITSRWPNSWIVVFGSGIVPQRVELRYVDRRIYLLQCLKNRRLPRLIRPIKVVLCGSTSNHPVSRIERYF
jgi:hypothetical protein